MRRTALVVASFATLLALAGCGSEGVVSPRPVTVIGSLPKAKTSLAAPAAKLKGDPAKGKAIFLSAGCGGCHTLKAAGTNGKVGPDLDVAKPAFALVAHNVTFGKGAMPPFKPPLTDQQIADVAAFVVKATGGTPP
jgi:mono/diheme cytochrome c family protein